MLDVRLPFPSYHIMKHGFPTWVGNFLLLVLLSSNARSVPNHPFVLVDSNELEALRSSLAQNGWQAQLYRTQPNSEIPSTGVGIHANAEAWLARPIVIPARGGYGHNFFCEDGTRLEFPKNQEFAPGPYRCPKCHRLYKGERYEGALRRYVHQWLAQAARDLALAGSLEHRPDYKAKAAEILLKYTKAYPGPHTSIHDGGMIDQSLDEAMWVVPLAQAYDLVYNDISPQDRSLIEPFLHSVATGLQRCGLHGNWGSWHLSSVGLVGYAIGDTNLVDWATTQFRAQIADQLGDDGIWPESVHCYHFFALTAFCNFTEAAWHAGTDLYHWEAKPGKSLLSMFRAPVPYAYPDLRLPAINDGWFESYLPRSFYDLAWHRTHEPIFASVLKELPQQSDSIYSFLFDGDVPKDAPPLRLESTNYPVLGIATLRATNAMMTFHYGPFLGHGHPDKMGITFFADGKLWAADYGTPGYGSAILQWYKSTYAHNTILIDGKPEAYTTEHDAKVSLGQSPFELVSSTTRQAYPGVTWTRAVERQGDCFVICDKLSGEQSHTYDFYLHGEGSLTLDTPKGDDRQIKPASHWITDLVADKAAPSITARWTSNGNAMAVWITGTHPLTALHGKCPAESGTRQIPLLIARQEGTNAEFITLIFPCHDSSSISIKRQPGAIILNAGSRHETIALPAM